MTDRLDLRTIAADLIAALPPPPGTARGWKVDEADARELVLSGPEGHRLTVHRVPSGYVNPPPAKRRLYAGGLGRPGRPLLLNASGVTVAESRAPRAIAADIARRLLPNYYFAFGAADRLANAERIGDELALSTARDLAAAAGGAHPVGAPPTRIESRGNGRARFSAFAYDATVDVAADVNVSDPDDLIRARVDIKLTGLNARDATAVLAALRASRNPVAP